MRSLTVALPAFLTALVLSAGCPEPSSPVALRPDPKLDPKARCGQSAPLVVDWEPTARGQLEALRAGGVVAVRYAACAIEVLDCHAPGAYRYAAAAPTNERVVVRDLDALYTNLPVGAASLQERLRTQGALTAKLTVVGRYEVELASVRADDLKGDCAQATHVVLAMSLGAFDLVAGPSEAPQLLGHEGEVAACTASKPGDAAPPAGCDRPLRLQLAPIDEYATCERAGARLVSCGVRSDPTWMTVCPAIRSLPACASAAGDDCNALALCVENAFGAACTPAGTHTCQETAACYQDCTSLGQPLDCHCACTAGLAPDRALALLKYNSCWEVSCTGKTPVESEYCFAKSCRAEAIECLTH